MPGVERRGRSLTRGPTISHPSGDDRFDVLDKHLKRVRYEQDQLIETLHVAQGVFGHLSDDVLRYVAHALLLPPSMVFGVATFYHLFDFEPAGEHSCSICTGTACFVKGSSEIVEAVGAAYGVAPGATSDDGVLTLRTARCLGSCGLAPVMVLDGEVTGHQDPASALELIATSERSSEEVG